MMQRDNIGERIEVKEPQLIKELLKKNRNVDKEAVTL